MFLNQIENIDHFYNVVKKSRVNTFLIIQHEGEHLDLKLPNDKLFVPSIIQICDFFYMSVSPQKPIESDYPSPPSLLYYRYKRCVLQKPLEDDWIEQLLKILNEYEGELNPQFNKEGQYLDSGFNSGFNSIMTSQAGQNKVQSCDIEEENNELKIKKSYQLDYNSVGVDH